MIDSADSLLRLLLDRGLVSRSGAVDGDVVTVSDPARGWFRLIEKQRAQFFAASGRNETVHARLGAAEFLPDVRIREDGLFVIETFADGLDAVEFHRVSRRIAEWLPPLIGRVLASLHTTPIAHDGAISRELPAPMRGHDPALAAPAVAQAIARVASQWTGDALLHGDLGFDRIIVAPEPQQRIHLVGWDAASLGDPAWDCGAIVESYYAWGLDPTIIKDVEGPVCPLPPYALLPLIGSFWNSYATASRLTPIESRSRLVRAFGYAGVRLIDRVNRTLRKAEPVTPQLTQMIQAAIALMTAPAAAVDSFFAAPQPPPWAPAWRTW
jgi:hypothetical protein